MRELSSAGRQAVAELSRRHGFSQEAVLHLLQAVSAGNCTVAQFHHPEFGGPGQWMLSGMMMLTDMFNHALKTRIDGLCHELARLIHCETNWIDGETHQSHGQYGTDNKPAECSSASVATTAGRWWPADFPTPDSTGTRSEFSYAYFGQARRLAIQKQGRVLVYDTLDHRIIGFPPQPSGEDSISFRSQYGDVSLAALPVLSDSPLVPTSCADAANASVTAIPPSSEHAQQNRTHSATSTTVSPPGEDIFSMLEKLAALHEKKILTDEEYSTKKAELLKRL